MATSGEAYAISVAIYGGILLLIFCCFSVWRRLPFSKRFFSPKRFVPEEGFIPPPKLSSSFLGWIPQVVGLSEAQIIGSAGIDAAMYMKFTRMAWESFFLVSFIGLAIILPINLTSNTVDALIDAQYQPSPVSQFTFWIPPPPPPSPPTPPGENPPKQTQQSQPETPEFYNNTGIPDAPPGLTWTTYAAGVPSLPPAPPNYVWWYQSEYVPQNYYFTNLDKTTLSNVPQSSPKLIGHAIIAWAITFVLFVQLWRYSKEALRLRLFYLLNVPRGTESHTIMCTDIPGVAFGTIPNRLDGTLLKFVPGSMKKKALKQVEALGNAVDGAAGGALDAAMPLDGAKGGGMSSKASSRDAAALVSSLSTEVDAATGKWSMPDRWDNAVDDMKANAIGGTPGSSAAVEAVVSKEFESIYGKDFAHAHLVFNTSGVDGLVRKYESTAAAAEDLIDDYISKKSRGMDLKPKTLTVLGVKLGAWGREKYGVKPKKVDAFEFYVDYLTHLEEEIKKARKEAKKKVYPTAFITFNRRTAQVVAAKTLMAEDLTAWKCQPAPRPTEIVWSNLAMRSWERSGRSTLMWIAFIVLTLFYLIPVAAVQALVSTSSVVGFIQKIPIVSSVITAMLPGIVLAIFIALLPPIITAMNRWAGMVSLSKIDLGLMMRFFIFQVVTVFLGSFIAGSAANQFKQLIENPGSIVTLLGTAAPQTSIFFLTYVTLRALFIVPFSILRLVPFVVFWVKTKFLAATERAKARLWQEQELQYGTVVVQDTIVFLLGVTFSCICPIIAPAAFIYFTTNYIVSKYNLVYVYRQSYQTGAMAWPRMFYEMMTGLFCFQLIMICLLALKKSVAAPIICIPLPFLNIIFMQAVGSTFWEPMVALCTMAAAEIDRKEAAVADGGAHVEEDVATKYLSPALTIPESAAHAALLEDCRRMKAVLDGNKDEKLFERTATGEFVEIGEEMETAERAHDVEGGVAEASSSVSSATKGASAV